MTYNKNRQNTYSRNRSKERSPSKGESDHQYKNQVDISKFISRNESFRVDETNRQTVERVTTIEEKLKMEVF